MLTESGTLVRERRRSHQGLQGGTVKRSRSFLDLLGLRLSTLSRMTRPKKEEVSAAG